MAISLTKKSIQLILDAAPKEEVFAFISKLVREDKKLAIQLLARFSDYLDETEETKYDFLFYKPLLIYRTSSKALGLIKQRKIGKVYRELWTQAGDAIVRKHFVKTAHILCNGLIYMRHIMTGEPRIESNFEKLYLAYHERLAYFLSIKLPVELLEYVQDTLESELKNENYFPPNKQIGVALLLGQLLLNKHEPDILYNTISKLDRKNTQRAHLHKQQLMLALVKNDTDPWRFRNKYNYGFSQLDYLYILEYLATTNQFDLWEKLINRYYPKGATKIVPKLKRHFEEIQSNYKVFSSKPVSSEQ